VCVGGERQWAAEKGSGVAREERRGQDEIRSGSASRSGEWGQQGGWCLWAGDGGASARGLG